MESLRENKPLLYSLLASGGAMLCLASGLLPDVSAHFELVDLDTEVKLNLVFVCLSSAAPYLRFVQFLRAFNP